MIWSWKSHGILLYLRFDLMRFEAICARNANNWGLGTTKAGGALSPSRGWTGAILVTHSRLKFLCKDIILVIVFIKLVYINLLYTGLAYDLWESCWQDMIFVLGMSFVVDLQGLTSRIRFQQITWFLPECLARVTGVVWDHVLICSAWL